MNDSNNTNSLPAEPAYDTVIPHNQFTYTLFCILWNNTSQPWMTSKSLDSRDDASSHRCCVCCRVSCDVLDDLPQILLRAYCPDD
jgi:hypothetical protein